MSETTICTIQPAALSTTIATSKEVKKQSTCKGVLWCVVGHDAVVAGFGLGILTTFEVIGNMSAIPQASAIPARVLGTAAIGLGGYLGIKGCFSVANVGYRNAEYHLGKEKLQKVIDILNAIIATNVLLYTFKVI